MLSKPFWLSKTCWFNALALIVAIASEFGFSDFVSDPGVGSGAIAVVTAINLALRFITKAPVKVRKVN